ncbi:MAG: acyltransferase [Planctomycetota bacterium]
MARPLADFTDSRDNNFNLLRFLAAGLVLFAHSYPLTGTEPEPRLGGFGLGYVAVDIFFVTSGLLVTRSLLHRANVVAFAWARFVRIVPALFVAVLLCAYGFGLAFTELPAGEYLRRSEVGTFVFKNTALLAGRIRYELPGVFEQNPYKGAVNGSLWTLPWEVRMYLLLAGIGVAGLFLPRRRRAFALAAMILGVAAAGAIANLLQHTVGISEQKFLVHGIRLLHVFFLGGAAYVLRRFVPLQHVAFAVAMVALFALQGWKPGFHVLYPYLLAYGVLYLAYIPGGFLRGFNRLGDYSYGLYIYAFPVQQAIAALQPGVSMPVMFREASAATLLLAVLSWYLVEKPMLARKDAWKRWLPAPKA